MPKLLIVSRCSTPHGGADRIIADLCRELPAFDWDIRLGLTIGRKFNLREPYQNIYPDLPIHEIDGSLGTRASRVKAVKRCIEDFRPDIVLVMRVFDAISAATESKVRPRIVVGVRSYEADYLSDIRRYRDAIDGCVTSGKLIAKACTQWAEIEESRVCSIAGGVHEPVCTRRVREAGTPVRLMYAGRLEQAQKRCGDFVPFIRKMDEQKVPFALNIAGTGPLEESLKRTLSDYIDRGVVRFHGWLTREELYNNLYPNSDIFVHFAAWEGVTISPREAMAHGVVPVVSQFDGLETEGQFVDGHNSLTFPVGDIEAALDSVKRLIDSPQNFERLSRNACQSQMGCYSFKGSIIAWSHFFQRILGLPGRVGVVKRIEETLPGKMTRTGVPEGLQDWVRRVCRVPVEHRSAGSEWPTASGLLTEQEAAQLNAFADQLG